jgi:hypothetical protein
MIRLTSFLFLFAASKNSSSDLMLFLIKNAATFRLLSHLRFTELLLLLAHCLPSNDSDLLRFSLLGSLKRRIAFFVLGYVWLQSMYILHY